MPESVVLWTSLVCDSAACDYHRAIALASMLRSMSSVYPYWYFWILLQQDERQVDVKIGWLYARTSFQGAACCRISWGYYKYITCRKVCRCVMATSKHMSQIVDCSRMSCSKLMWYRYFWRILTTNTLRTSRCKWSHYWVQFRRGFTLQWGFIK